MANIVNVTVESLETINTNSGGAQWVINRPKANYWKKVYLDSNRLYRYLRGQKQIYKSGQPRCGHSFGT